MSTGDYSPFKPISIFTPAHYEKLVNAERQLREALPTIEAAERCNINCDHWRALYQSAMAQLDAIKHNFMNPPPGA